MSRLTVIAHRGACGYLPEHTLEGVAMAHAMGADYIELDVTLSRDGELIVLHDLYLDAVSNVAERFPDRNRADGHHYAIDFTLDEIRTLRLHARTDAGGLPVFPGRFPHGNAIFRIPTLAEEITLIQGLNRSRGREVGLYIEPKSPAWHADQGRDIAAAVLDALSGFGYRARSDCAVLQSFDLACLQYGRFELGSDLKMVQLIGENEWGESASDFDYLRTETGLRDIAGVADGIGPALHQVVTVDAAGSSEISELTALAHRAGLFVHAYTLQTDEPPAPISRVKEDSVFLRDTLGLDGIFTDFPDRVVNSLTARG